MHKLEISANLSPMFNDMQQPRIVMLGEASHGTHEFYTWRTAISKKLIEEKDFSFIAVEGDWPDCYKLNRFVKGYKDAGDSIMDVLKSFDRWPTWMWANWEVAALAEWLREHNKHLPIEKKIGFYGLDVYSLWDSMREMVLYLEKADPHTALAVKKAIRCFEPYEENEHAYARISLNGHSCRDEVVALLKEVRLKAHHLNGDREAALNTEQNALIAVNAEKYYSSMIGFNNDSWNVRDTHMMQTLDRLMDFHGKGAKGIVWAHNTHIGDARATSMKRNGMVNMGQLAREAWGFEKVYLVGFGAYQGRVIAGENWGAPMQEMTVPRAREGSIEYELHRMGSHNKLLIFSELYTPQLFQNAIHHRAIGVVYDPDRERYGNYVPSVMADRYNAFIYLDDTVALHALGLPAKGDALPETYPFGV